ncbi:MAG TPA: cadherin repeat domain-containing protein, partial [Solirubrobacteraceae bacterium]|nr:cadherin repeat domain-containing protein [Solirubrobacteraceae bacterium]
MTGDRDVETAVRPRGRRVAHLLALVACAVVAAPALAGAAPLARVADVAYGPLAAVGVSAHGATISGRDLRVRIRLRRRAGIRLSVVAGDEIRGYAKRSLAPGSYLFHGRLDRAPQGSGLMLRITARLADGRRGRERFKLTVLAANHAPTALALSNAAVAENQPAGTSVGAFSDTDADRSDVPAFALVSGPGGQDNAAFRITGATLRTAASFDFETRSSYSIRVRVTDGHGGSFERTFTIGVTNVNEPPVGLALTGGRVAENQPAGTTVGTLTATDPDAGDTVAFALVGGPGSADNAAFTISGATLRTAGSFDFETKSSYTVRVVASDGRGGSTEQAFVIAVTNVDEAPLVVASAGSTAYLE